VAARVHLEKFRRPGFALQDIDLDQLVRNVELRQREPDLVAIARAAHGIEFVHASPRFMTADIADKRAKHGDCKALT
jgi:hypothetical protein